MTKKAVISVDSEHNFNTALARIYFNGQYISSMPITHIEKRDGGWYVWYKEYVDPYIYYPLAVALTITDEIEFE